ncbi:MAG TPA: alpha-amylase family glycosyl hydrolase [Bacteroidales bacterium]|nr:alpha-amylase family glycosyl hydrolase [Bacteroidales bacterium]
MVIYQVLPRYFGNEGKNIPNGSLIENGCGKFNDFTSNALDALVDLGCTHLWFTGILEHATKTDYSTFGIRKDHPAVVKGRAGSPYAVKDYYDVDPDLAQDPIHRIEEFKDLMARTHRAGLKVLIDFVPNHVARQYGSDQKPEAVRDFGADDRSSFGFHQDNNFYYVPEQPFSPSIDLWAGEAVPYEEFPAKATGNNCFSAQPNVDDWYETVKINYGVDYMNGSKTHFYPVPTTWFKMLDILLYWANFGVDGFRCDMAEMVPVEFWGWVIPRVKSHHPDLIFVAEVYQPSRYWDYIHVGKFDLLYDKEGMYNAVRAIVEGHQPASNLSGCWQAVNDYSKNMLHFLENHDEQRIASDFFAGNPQKAFPAMMVLATMKINPIMIYAGQELGERGMYTEGFSGLDGRNSIFDYWSIESLVAFKNNGLWNEDQLTAEQKGIRSFYKRLLEIHQKEKAVREGEFFDLEYANLDRSGFDATKIYAFIRKAGNECLLCLINFDGVDRKVSLMIPKHAFDCLNLEDGRQHTMTELFSGQIYPLMCSSIYPIELDVPAFGGLLLKCII